MYCGRFYGHLAIDCQFWVDYNGDEGGQNDENAIEK